MEKRHYKRVTATAIVMLINLILSAIFLASFTNVFNVTCYGKNLFDFADYLTGSYTMGLLIALYSIFMGWKIWPQISDNLCTSYVWYKSYMKLLLKWLVPLSLGILFIVA